MNPDHITAGKRFRRRVAKEMRRAFKQIRRDCAFVWRSGKVPPPPYSRCPQPQFVIGDVAYSADMTADELRGFLFGTRDLDVHRMGKLAWTLGLKFKHEFFVEADAASPDESRLAS
ncbi:MAG: hypothetical protein ING29_12995 [Azospirillum sp.]|nr:hypothetical protein [Azospirillum sp.]